jgi:CxxC motif-containing protein (DUF1111 family)
MKRCRETLFDQIGHPCHRPTIQTGQCDSGTRSRGVPPYSDFLLHDMGTSGTSAGYRQWPRDAHGSALGLRLLNRYLHDGRRKRSTRLSAVTAAGRASRDRFGALNESDRAALLAFLGSL